MNIETCSNTNTNGYKWIPFFFNLFLHSSSSQLFKQGIEITPDQKRNDDLNSDQIFDLMCIFPN